MGNKQVVPLSQSCFLFSLTSQSVELKSPPYTIHLACWQMDFTKEVEGQHDTIPPC